MPTRKGSSETAHADADRKRRFDVGCAVAQGEVMEVEHESALRQQVPFDTIEPVPVSFNGGDVMQHVFDNTGQMCGTILWKSKRTKSWNANWLPKLRDDQRAAKAHIAALLTAELPKGTANFGCIDGTWSPIAHVWPTTAVAALKLYGDVK